MFERTAQNAKAAGVPYLILACLIGGVGEADAQTTLSLHKAGTSSKRS